MTTFSHAKFSETSLYFIQEQSRQGEVLDDTYTRVRETQNAVRESTEEQSRQGEVLDDTYTRVRETQNDVREHKKEQARQGEVFEDTNARVRDVQRTIASNGDGKLKYAIYIEQYFKFTFIIKNISTEVLQ